MKEISLSLCMPTYNFGKFIGETIESILPQMTPHVELVIVDGGSTDETPSVVDKYLKKNPNIRYKRLAKKGGIDHDMAHSVELARGDYVWLFSSDDIMRPNAIQKLQLELKSSLDVYLCGFTICGLDTKNTYWDHPIFKIKKTTDFNLSNSQERKLFFREAITTTAFFSFMGSLIIKRKRWNETDIEKEFFGSCWAHAARIFKMLDNGLQVRYLPNSFLLKRGFNDSFLDRGIVHRTSIVIDGYHHLANTFFGENSFEAFHIRRVVQYELPLSAILVSVKSQVKTPEEGRRLDQMVLKLYQDPSLMNRLRKLIYFRLPSSWIRSLAYIYEKRSFFKHFRILGIKQVFCKLFRNISF